MAEGWRMWLRAGERHAVWYRGTTIWLSGADSSPGGSLGRHLPSPDRSPQRRLDVVQHPHRGVQPFALGQVVALDPGVDPGLADAGEGVFGGGQFGLGLD